MPSKNTVFLLASLLSTLQFVPLLVTAADPTSSFRTQTLSTKPLPASTLSVVSGGTSNNAVAGRDVVSSGLHNREHHYEHKARDGVPGYLTWVFNNCAKTVSNGYVLDYGPIAGADDGITHMNNLLKANPNKIFTNQAWTGASSDKNCGRIACHDQTNVAVRWCNYNKLLRPPTLQACTLSLLPQNFIDPLIFLVSFSLALFLKVYTLMP
ncbi:hypothetical protein B0T20DRAFT_208176 [Sordaria brevicollis]|uniref:Uncharacterized protein n=1 Tax=Sordaria brevicollis TaxID=83679 RepID=A0AAE0UBV6_SORBR|nr:hypothetical protein B0T20DRAFT_208176 [Sordaria brevicollis]